MFVEDISLSIMPYEFDGANWTLQLDTDKYPEAMVAQLFPTRNDSYRTTLREKAADFIEETSRYLAYEGTLWYEIVRPPTNQPPNHPPFVLEQLPLGRLTQLPWCLIQHVPRGSRRRLGKRFVTIPVRDIWHVAIPLALGTAREHRSLLRSLSRNPFPPPFAIDAMAPGEGSNGYDFTLHRQANQEWVAYITRRWGWTGRGMWEEHSSEYFMVHRTLRFRRAQILLRDHIIDQMNALLHREGIDASIVVEGLATVGAVDSMLAQLEQGTAAYTDALSLLRQ